jgi:hypothetical protein
MTSGLLLGSGGGSGSGGGGSGSGSGAVVGMLIPTAAVGSAGAPSGCTSPLAALRTNDGLSSPTAAGGSRTPGSNHAKGPRQLVYLGRLYGSEVVGRKCCVQLRGGARTFDKAVIVDFNDASGQHRVRHAATKAEEWVSLGDIKFYWREAAPPEAPPNPSFKPECSSEACVGRRLRVYWPAMQKWYCGSVKAYDPLTGQHTVFYKVCAWLGECGLGAQLLVSAARLRAWCRRVQHARYSCSSQGLVSQGAGRCPCVVGRC